jgi:hypothetical protein
VEVTVTALPKLFDVVFLFFFIFFLFEYRKLVFMNYLFGPLIEAIFWNSQKEAIN